MPIYLKITGADGNATAKGHDKEIEVSSFQWGVGRGISAAVGNVANRESSEPSVSEVVVTKSADVASNRLLELALGLKDGAFDSTISFTRTAAGGVEDYLVYTLSNCLVSGFSLSSGGDNPTESLSLNFTKMESKFLNYAADHKTNKPDTVIYDLTTGTK